MKFSDLKMRPDLFVIQAFGIYDRHVKNGMLTDPEGRMLTAAQVLDAAGAPRDAVRLALLCAMPPESHDRLEREDLKTSPHMVVLVREWQRLVEDDFRGIHDSTDEVKAVVLATETARLRHFTMEMKKFDEDRRGRRLEEPYIPTFEDMERCENLRDTATGGEGNFSLDLLFRETLEEAGEHYEESVRLTRNLGKYNPEAAAALLARREPFEKTKLLDEPVVRAAYGVVGGAPLMRERDLEAAVETGALLSTIPRVTGSTVAAALVDVALRGREPSYPLQADLGANVARALKDFSIYTVDRRRQVEKAPAEFKQILLAHGAQMMREDIREGRWRLKQAARRELGPGDLSGVFGEFAEKKEYLRDIVLPAAGKTGAPALDRLFRRRYGTFTRLLDTQKKTTERKPGP